VGAILVASSSLSSPVSGTSWPSSVGCELRAIAAAIALYRIDNGVLPVHLRQLLAPTENADTRYLDLLPRDAWLHDYVYQPADGEFALRSMGPNGLDEQGAGDDIVHPADCAVRADRAHSTPIGAWAALSLIACGGIYGLCRLVRRRMRLQRVIGTGRRTS
jgi:hypothetical protein